MHLIKISNSSNPDIVPQWLKYGGVNGRWEIIYEVQGSRKKIKEHSKGAAD